MAVDKKAVYDNALLLLGQRALSAVDEDRAARYALDAAWDLGAEDYCLEIVQPLFATKTVELDSPSVSSEHALDEVHTLPNDFISVVGVYSDDKLDQPISRFIIEADTLACEYDPIYLRYTVNPDDLTKWSPSSLRVLAAYLAREIAIKVAPHKWEEMNALLVDRVEITKGLEGEKEVGVRSVAPSVTLTNTWRHIYNDALLVMGLDEISSNTDDSNRRVKLDRALDAGLVADLLEDVGWNFAIIAEQITYDSSIEPTWGFRRAHNKPANLHRLDGLFSDEYLQQPLKPYQEHDGNYYCDYDTIYIQYVTDTFLTTPDNWPPFFKRLVAGRMARDAASSLKGEGADLEVAATTYESRRNSALSNDAVSSPPRKISQGSWVRARGSYNNDRNRP